MGEHHEHQPGELGDMGAPDDEHQPLELYHEHQLLELWGMGEHYEHQLGEFGGMGEHG